MPAVASVVRARWLGVQCQLPGASKAPTALLRLTPPRTTRARTPTQEGLDPRVRAAKEKELAGLQQRQAQKQQQEREKRLATKYHKVGMLM
jgi:hypothetical protein